MREFPRWNPEGRGCKGGTGPTKGKKAKTFLVRLPDDSEVKKRAFDIEGDRALAIAYYYDGTGYDKVAGFKVIGVYNDPPEWARNGQYIQIPVEVIKD